MSKRKTELPLALNCINTRREREKWKRADEVGEKEPEKQVD